MENVNFQACGDEIERALMDLGPLLGVSIKEEVPEEITDGSAPPAASLNVSFFTYHFEMHLYLF